MGNGWLLERLGDRFVVLTDGWDGDGVSEAEVLDLSDEDNDDLELLRRRYDLHPGSAYLIRPDQYVAARWRKPVANEVAQAIGRAKGYMS
jgi:3-(3-hydroxy-phenyl)propionate hydroxylase